MALSPTAKNFSHLYTDFEKTKNHLINCVDFTQKKGVVGCHNSAQFDEAINKYKLIVVEDPTFNNNDLKTIKYHVEALDRELKPTGKPKGTTPLEQTVYNASKYSDEFMFQLGSIAAEKAFRNGLNKVKGIREFTETAGGIKFRFYLNKNTDLIENFHPVTK